MRVRLLLTMCGAVAVAVSGCNRPQAEFVSDDGASELMRPARRALEEKIESHFGTPHDLVAWMELPVDYGEMEGEVTDENASLSAFEVELASTSETDASFKSEELRQAGVLWLSGIYKDATYETKDGETGPVIFRVAGYDVIRKPDPDKDKWRLRLHITTSPPLSPETEPPQKGDKFAIVGHTLQKGRQAYMRNCMHCHGVSGDGNGPTAKYLNPRPRDYRRGIFKFTSTGPTDKAQIGDLRRIVEYGIPGTYMPSFKLLPEDDLHAIIPYVRWLAMRGELERKLLTQLSTDYSLERLQGEEDSKEVKKELEEYLADYFPGLFEELTEELVSDWSNAEEGESVVVVPKKARIDPHADPESIARGRKLFLDNRGKAKCLTCHGSSGRGNGPSNEDFNDVPGSIPPVKSAKPGLFDVWGNQIKPRDLTRGIYRGGRRPLDIYRRIYSGIKGTPMQAFGTTLKDEEIWDLVNYVLHIPFEDRSPEYRAKMYKEQPQQAAAESSSDVGS